MSMRRAWLVAVVVLSTAGCFRVGLDRFHGAVTDDGGSDASAGDADADGDADLDADADVDADGDADGDVDADLDGAPDADEWEAGPCDETPCRLVAPQCGCRPGSVCQRPYGDDPRRECVPPGSAGHLEPCSVNLDCATALVCVTATDAPGLCLPYCGTSADCPAGSFCAEMWVTSEPIGTCPSFCDPLTGDTCPSGTGCLFVLMRRLDDAELVDATTCSPDDALPGVGERCDVLCRQGAACVGEICEQLCVLSSPVCATGSCRTLGGAVIRGVEYGTCR